MSVKNKMTMERAEEMLSAFDLLLHCVEKDCGRMKWLKGVKNSVQRARKQLRDIPVPKGMK